ncbi:MAG: hypothetical protein ABEJ26_09925 [Halosimplex sp.]
MQTTRPNGDGPASEEEFERNLIWLIRSASDNGVDVAGGWMDRTGDPDRSHWGIEIYEVTAAER